MIHHARARPLSRMLSLRLGGMITPRQISTKFIPTQPESVTESVNIKKEIHVYHAVFRQVPCLDSNNSFKKSNIFWILLSILDKVSTGNQTSCE